MSAAEHRAAARSQEQAPAPVAAPLPAGVSGLPDGPGQGPFDAGAVLWRAPGTTPAGMPSAERERHVRAHLAAAATLEAAERDACQAAPHGAGASCPLEHGVTRITAIPGGIRILVDRQVSPGSTLAAIRCHLARAAVLGFTGMPGCPLYLRGVGVKDVPGQPDALDLVARSPAEAAALQNAVRAALH